MEEVYTFGQATLTGVLLDVPRGTRTLKGVLDWSGEAKRKKQTLSRTDFRHTEASSSEKGSTGNLLTLVGT